MNSVRYDNCLSVTTLCVSAGGPTHAQLLNVGKTDFLMRHLYNSYSEVGLLSKGVNYGFNDILGLSYDQMEMHESCTNSYFFSFNSISIKEINISFISMFYTEITSPAA